MMVDWHDWQGYQTQHVVLTIDTPVTGPRHAKSLTYRVIHL
jgi:hypothetical protein